MKTSQDFIEKYYPDYSNSEERAEEQDLFTELKGILSGEHPHGHLRSQRIAEDEWYKARKDILEKAIEGFIAEQEATKNNSISIVWCVDDVLGQAKVWNIDCSEAEAMEILQHLKQNHNLNHGITWGDIDHRLDMLVYNRKKALAENNK